MNAPSSPTLPGDATVAPEALARALLGCVGLLALVGLAVAASASPPGEAWAGMTLHLVHLGLGLGAFLVAWHLPPERLRQLAWPASWALAALLAVLLFGGWLHASNQAARWIRIGPMSFQPSLLLQFLWPVALASWVARDPLRLRQPRALGRLALRFALLTLPVLLQPDLGSVVILLFVGGVTLMFSGAPIRLLQVSVLSFVVLLAVASALFPHVGSRLDWWQHPSEQVERGVETLSAAGPLGRGPGLGVMKFGHVPEGRTDFVLTLVGEEWGLPGTLFVWSLFLAFTFLGLALARRARSRYGVVLMVAATVMIAFQAAYNLAMVVGMLPVKGLPLPFVSRGGSSLLALSALLGAALRAALDARRARPPLPGLLP